MVEFVEKPLINLRQIMNLVDGISFEHCFCDDEYSLIGRFIECLVEISNLQFFVLYKSVHALTNHTQSLLYSLFKVASYRHHLAY